MPDTDARSIFRFPPESDPSQRPRSERGGDPDDPSVCDRCGDPLPLDRICSCAGSDTDRLAPHNTLRRNLVLAEDDYGFRWKRGFRSSADREDG